MTNEELERNLLTDAIMVGKATRDQMMAEAKQGTRILNIMEFRTLEKDIATCEAELAKMTPAPESA